MGTYMCHTYYVCNIICKTYITDEVKIEQTWHESKGHCNCILIESPIAVDPLPGTPLALSIAIAILMLCVDVP